MVSIDASDAGIRLHTPDSPGLMGFLNAVTPGELAPFAAAALRREKRALPPLPSVMPWRRDGWLLDATQAGLQVWSQGSNRAVRIEPAFFFAAVELYARAALEPWEGRLVAEPGGSLDGRAPAWVDGLRVAHIDLLTALRRAGIARMEVSDAAPGALDPGRYANEQVAVRVADDGLHPESPDLAAIVEGWAPSELPAIAESIVFGDASPRESLLACAELALRHAVRPWSGVRVGRADGEDAPVWVGRARYSLGLATGRLLGDRLTYRPEADE
ncbi:MAG: hypothetical protein R3F61_13775 [Myxococcota bacterium]